MMYVWHDSVALRSRLLAYTSFDDLITGVGYGIQLVVWPFFQNAGGRLILCSPVQLADVISKALSIPHHTHHPSIHPSTDSRALRRSTTHEPAAAPPPRYAATC